jgi:D-aminoacyl-tRNA deacylase
MKLVIQRVRSASVTVDAKEVARIAEGALVLVGVARGDSQIDVRYLARKTSQLRIFDDDAGRLNNAIGAVKGAAFLVVSQFTLYADCSGGNRPSYIDAAEPEEAKRLYEEYARELQILGHEVQTGVFGAKMAVRLLNDGPVTIIMESRGRQTP